MEAKVVAILNEMAEYLSVAQMKKLQEVMLKAFTAEEAEKKAVSNDEYLKMFLEAKKVEGCSDRTIQYYQTTVEKMLASVTISVRNVTTEMMREYLSDYQQANNCSKVTVDNIRRNISSFFSWLEEENYILKSPMKRIHKIKTNHHVKEVISDEDIERIRDSCSCKRDLAIIDLLWHAITAMRNLHAHDYERVDLEIVWDTLINEIPDLRSKLIGYLENNLEI